MVLIQSRSKVKRNTDNIAPSPFVLRAPAPLIGALGVALYQSVWASYTKQPRRNVDADRFPQMLWDNRVTVH